MPPRVRGRFCFYRTVPTRGRFVPRRRCRMTASLDQIQQAFLVILHKVQTHALVCFRNIRCYDRRTDHLTEPVESTWAWFLRLYQRGKDPTAFPMVLADLAVRHVRAGRRLCGAERAKETMSYFAQHRGGFSIEPLPTS